MAQNFDRLNNDEFGKFPAIAGLIKYIMLLKLPIILFRNSFNFYLLPIIPKIIPKLLL